MMKGGVMENGNGNILRILSFVVIANLTMLVLSSDWFVFIVTLITWWLGMSIWFKNFSRHETENRELNVLIGNFWFLIVIFRWSTFDKVQPDKEKHYCKSCHRLLIEEGILRTKCGNASEFPTDDSAYAPQLVRYCANCEEAPHVRMVDCQKGRRPCPDINCVYRKD